MTRISTHIIILLLLLFVTTTVDGKSRRRKTTATDEQTILIEQSDANTRRRLQYFFLEAVRRQQRGDYAAAFDLLLHCRTIDPCAAEVYFALAPYHATLDDNSSALISMTVAAALQPANATYTERLAEANINMGLYAEAAAGYEKLYAANRSRDDILSILLQLYGAQEDYDAMLDVIDRMETAEGSGERITIERMRVYARQGRDDLQFGELDKLVSANPDEPVYRIMRGNRLLQAGRTAEARADYDYVLAREPDNTQALMSMLDYYAQTGQDTLLNALQRRLIVSETTPVKTRTTMMVKYATAHRNDTAAVDSLFREATARPQTGSAMYELYASWLELIGAPADTTKNILRRAIDIEPDNAGARLRLVQTLWRERNYDEVIALCEPAIAFNPDEMVFYYFRGMASYVTDDHDAALRTFRKGVSQIKADSDREIVSDFYAVMGDILFERGSRTEAYAAYDSSLQWKPDNVSCMNNYAYYLSLDGTDLGRAELMSRRTVNAEPTNSTYLDTYAWVLFRQGRYAEAQAYIDMAMDNDTTASAVIIEHAGDIAAMNGNTDRAVDYWQRALGLDPDNALLARKIRLRRYIEEDK